MQVVLKAPAKINLGLIVKNKRVDGYHDIDTIMVPIRLFDKIKITKTSPGIRLKTNTRKAGTAKKNLVYRAAQMFFATTGISGGVDIELTKKIPIGAGLGGGSSDAAATLLGLNKLYKNILSFEQLKALAVKIGMDVAFFLYRRACIATGRGEILKPIKIPKMHIVLSLPKFSVSTQWAYQEISKFEFQNSKLLNNEGLTTPISHKQCSFSNNIISKKHNLGNNAGLTDRDFSLKLLSKKLRNNGLIGVNALAVNTFENVVFKKHPDLLKVKAQLLANGAYLASLSGSGSAVYAIFDKNALRTKKSIICLTLASTKRVDNLIFITESIP